MTRIEGQFLWVAQALHKGPDSFIPLPKIKAIHDAVLRTCDAKDGVKDGIIDEPQRCSFDPKVLACSTSNRGTCLSQSQITAARSVYSSSRNPRTNEVLYPGLAPGSELGWSREPVGQVLEQPSPLVIGFLKNIVFADPSWDYRTFDFDKDTTLADQRGGVLNAIDPNLGSFFARGGNLLQYHGWADGQLSPVNSINYYNSVAKAMGGTNRISDSCRLFMVPGMDHCRGGEGTDRFDMLSAVVDWVERGTVPNQISASRVSDGKVNRTRPLCPYPQAARYKGSGSIEDAGNFVCKIGP